MTSVDLVIADATSPGLRLSFSTDSLVIIAFMSCGDSIFILMLAITAPISTLSILPSKTFLALISINHLYNIMLLITENNYYQKKILFINIMRINYILDKC